MKKTRKGFTLIELLVVIAIIAILATIIIINVQRARIKAIDSKTMADLSQSSKVASLCITSGKEATSALEYAGSDICSDPTQAPGTWPDLTSANGYGAWRMGLNVPIDSETGFYTMGGNASVYGFTAFYENADGTTPTKFIRCTFNGCIKRGF